MSLLHYLGSGLGQVFLVFHIAFYLADSLLVARNLDLFIKVDLLRGLLPVEVENPAATEGTATLFDDILMIPHSDLTEAVLSISYRKNSSSDPDEIERLSLNLSDTDVKAWEKGQSYRYTLQLNMGSISVNVSVLPWVQENTSVEW